MKDLQKIHKAMTEIRELMGRVIMGQEQIQEQLLTCFLAGGHVLLEGVPGLGKTLLARTLVVAPLQKPASEIDFAVFFCESDFCPLWTFVIFGSAGNDGLLYLISFLYRLPRHSYGFRSGAAP